MQLTPGTALGSYEIISPLGSGGMGDVYRARDTKLNRNVALKVLRPDVANDPDRLARFRREAQLLAALNHPHIGAIHGLQEDGETTALVLEIVEGPTLADRIALGPIPQDEALRIAKQIAEALEAAHEQGIVHRDLKPANIKVREDGTVKVLDFGLARALDPTPTVEPGATHSPTVTVRTTGVGVILGTPAYMSPEQAQGRGGDKRSDAWAFGCVFYEMLTGRRAFGGNDLPLVLAAVMTQSPDWGALPSRTPDGLRRLLRRCVEKDPRRRLQSIGDARVQIEELLTDALDDGAEAPAERAASRQWLLITAAVAAAASLVTAGIVSFARRTAIAPQRVSRLLITPPPAAALSIGVSRDVAITPDGSQIVYVGANGSTLFLRPLDQLDAMVLVRAAAPRHPFVSPDGRWVGFFDGGFSLKKVPITGGPPVSIARFDSYERGATWLSDGTIVFATQSTTAGLRRVSADGGAPSTLTQPNRARGEVGHAWPEPLPDGHSVLYTILPTTGGLDAASLAVLDLWNGRSTILFGGASHAQYSTSGHLLFGAAGGLRAIGFDAARMRVVGPPAPIVPQVVTSSFGAVDAALAADGTLVYVFGGGGSGGDRRLVWVDRQGRETPLASPPRSYYFPRLSRDGSRVAVNAVVEQNSDLWVWDLGRATLTRVTSDPALDGYPLWMPRGDRLVFASNRAGAFNLFSQAASVTDAAERLTESANAQFPSDILPDNTGILFSEASQTTAFDVMMLTLDASKRVLPLVQTPFDERNPIVSSDMRWLAYEANDTGAFEIYVRPFPDVNGGRWQVSNAGGTQPLWARGGHELFFFGPDGALMRVAVSPGQVWTAAAPEKVLEGRYVVSTGGNVPRNYDVSPDGQRFLMLEATEAAGAPSRIAVVQHFDEELRRVVPAKQP